MSGQTKSTEPKLQRMRTLDFRKTYKDAPFNPPERTGIRATKTLRDSMHEFGFMPNDPITVSHEFRGKAGKWIADGHRRLTAASEEHIEYVYYVVSPLDLEVLWAKMNGTLRAPSVRETGTAFALGLKIPPPNRERIMRQLVETAGSWEAARKVLESKSPGVVLVARRIANYCFNDERWDDTRNEFVMRVIFWLIDHKVTRTVSDAISSKGIAPDALFDKIVSNQPISSRWE